MGLRSQARRDRAPGAPPRVDTAVGRFMLGSLAAIAVIVVGGFFALRNVAIDEATGDTRDRVRAEARLVEAAGLSDGIVRGDRAAIGRLDDLVARPDPRRLARPREAVDQARRDPLLRRAGAHRQALRARRGGARALRHRRRRGRGERPRRAREPLRAPAGQAAGGAHDGPHAGRHPAAVRDLPALQLGQRERHAAARRARAAARRRADRALPLPGAARVVDGAPPAARPPRARGSCSAPPSRPPTRSAGGSPPTCTTASCRTSPASRSGSRR